MKRIAGVSERLLECAKEEFLDKGFQSASIRDIAKKQRQVPALFIRVFLTKKGCLMRLFHRFQMGSWSYI